MVRRLAPEVGRGLNQGMRAVAAEGIFGEGDKPRRQIEDDGG